MVVMLLLLLLLLLMMFNICHNKVFKRGGLLVQVPKYFLSKSNFGSYT